MTGPVHYWQLSEPEGATWANNSVAANSERLTVVGTGSSVRFGTEGLSTGAQTAAEFTFGASGVGQWLKGPAVNLPQWTVSVFCLRATGTSNNPIAFGSDLDTTFSINCADDFVFAHDGAALFLSHTLPPGQTFNDPHHLAVTYDGTNARLYVDGVLADTSPGSTLTGNVRVNDPVDPGKFAAQHVAIHDHALTAAKVRDIADAGLNGFEGETTDQRFARYAAWSHIPTDEISTTASTVELAHIPSQGQTPLDLMRKVETAEGGVLYDSRDGKLTLHSRSARYGAPVAVTLDASLQEVGVDFAPTVDGQSLYNMGEGRNLAGTITATYNDENSREEYGDATYSVETASTDPNEPLQLAAWVVNANAEPRPRAASVTVDLTPFATPTMQAIANLDIGSKIRLTNLPAQSPGGTTSDWFVEGYSERFGVGEWSITFNLSPSWPIDSLLILDDPVHGVLDDGNLLAL